MCMTVSSLASWPPVVNVCWHSNFSDKLFRLRYFICGPFKLLSQYVHSLESREMRAALPGELRHSSWPDVEVLEVLGEHGLQQCRNICQVQSKRSESRSSSISLERNSRPL